MKRTTFIQNEGKVTKGQNNNGPYEEERPYLKGAKKYPRTEKTQENYKKGLFQTVQHIITTMKYKKRSFRSLNSKKTHYVVMLNCLNCSTRINLIYSIHFLNEKHPYIKKLDQILPDFEV